MSSKTSESENTEPQTRQKVAHLVLHSLDARLKALLASALQPDFEVTREPARERIRQIAKKGEADLLLLDFDGAYGTTEEQLSFYEEISESAIPIVVMADEMARSTNAQLLRQGTEVCIRTSLSHMELIAVIRRAYEHSRQRHELSHTREESARMHVESARIHEESDCTFQCARLVGSSGKAQVVYDLIRRVANLNASVLITGESGTGKELIARAIHSLGNRAMEPFVAVSCGAIPETLIEAELFGHEKGAFTGSAGARAGYFERAGEGTLFLDEIAELSPGTQVKLLRALQQKEFCRLGSNKLIRLKARVLFATHRNLQQMVAEGTFRQDLFFRVNVMPIHSPALRERPEDIPALARHFLNKYADECDKAVVKIAPVAMDALVEYDWPGNVRELENVIQGAVIMADGDSIGRPEIARQLSLEDEAGEQDDDGSVVSSHDSFEELIRQFKTALANNTVRECNGNKTLAARKLHVSRAYLHRLIRIDPEKHSGIELVA